MLFKQIVEAFLMPSMSLFGIVGNFIAIFVLHHKEVKLRKDFAVVLSSLAIFDILFLICTFFLFSLPTWSTTYERYLFPMLVPVLFPMTNTFMTASIYMTVAVAVNRYMEMAMDLVVPCRVHSGVKQALIVFIAAALFNFPRWLEFDYVYQSQVLRKLFIHQPDHSPSRKWSLYSHMLSVRPFIHPQFSKWTKTKTNLHWRPGLWPSRPLMTPVL